MLFCWLSYMDKLPIHHLLHRLIRYYFIISTCGSYCNLKVERPTTPTTPSSANSPLPGHYPYDQNQQWPWSSNHSRAPSEFLSCKREQPTKPLRGLASFGNNFLSKFEGAEVPGWYCKKHTIIHTPGVWLERSRVLVEIMASLKWSNRLLSALTWLSLCLMHTN